MGSQRLACSRAHIYKRPFILCWAFPIPLSCCCFGCPSSRDEAVQPMVSTGMVGEQRTREGLWQIHGQGW